MEPNGVTSSPSTNIRLSVEEKAKTVISVCTSGTLCTISSFDGISGAPFGSFVDYVLDDDGNPVLLMNEMSMHTVNIVNNPAGMVTLFAQLGAGGGIGQGNKADNTPSKGQDISRCSITGTIKKLNPKDTDDMDTIRMRYSLTHVYADQVMDSPKFAFYRIKASKVYFVGGFGVLAKWVSLDEYKTAEPDILAKDAGYIITKLNREYMDDLVLTAQHLMGCKDVENIRVTNVDRLGMDIRVTSAAKRKNKLITDEFRIGFRIPVISVEDAKSEILKIFQEAWEKGNGVQWGEGEADIPGYDIPIVKIAADSLE
jgi:putative heme iron utilization protein